jgi:hypothetical protein
MTVAREFISPVVSGRFPEPDARRIGDAIKRLDGKKVLVTVAEVKRVRTTQQNRYYWGCVVKLITDAFRDAGNMVNAEDVHEFLKAEVGRLSQVLVTRDGEVLRGPGSTAKLTTTEFSNYIEVVKAWAAEVLGLAIPSPDEYMT